MPYYAIYFNEDGDPPSLDVFATKKALLTRLGDDPEILDPKDVDGSGADVGWLVIEGKALKRIDKRVVTDLE